MESEPRAAINLSQRHTFRIATEYHYVSSIPNSAHSLLVLALHGYGMNATTMMDLTAPVFGDFAAIASIQAPNQFYLQQGLSNSKVGFNWGTRELGSSSIALHHEMVRQVAAEMRERTQLGRERTLLLGFSQPVGFNYRFGSAFPGEVGGIVGICGGVPKDWETGNYGSVDASILHIARDEDEFFPASVTADYARKLRVRAADVEFHCLPGGHRFPSKGTAVIRPWLERVFGVTFSGGGLPSITAPL